MPQPGPRMAAANVSSGSCSSEMCIRDRNIFSAGIGELFVIRLAGNVIDDHQLGSIEYAAGHRGCRLVVVLGHTHCGAVDAAINYEPSGYIRYITDEIQTAIGDETDPYKASCLNVRHSVQEDVYKRQDKEQPERINNAKGVRKDAFCVALYCIQPSIRNLTGY